MKTLGPLRVLALGSAALALGCGALAFGCGGAGSADFADASDQSPRTGSGDDAGASGDDATVSGPDPGTPGQFAPSKVEAGSTVIQSACAPGLYEGTFMTYVGAGGDGGSAGPFSYMWNGTLSIDLTGKKVTMTSTTQGGEGFTSTTSTTELSIADGGALDGSDMIGGSFFANLSGELDCSPDAGPTFHLAAELSNGSYKTAFYQLAMVGNLTADYQEAGASTPPMLVNGAILVGGLLGDSGAPFASASGTWSATWVSP
jgi:hypothetical protein